MELWVSRPFSRSLEVDDPSRYAKGFISEEGIETFKKVAIQAHAAKLTNVGWH